MSVKICSQVGMSICLSLFISTTSASAFQYEMNQIKHPVTTQAVVTLAEMRAPIANELAIQNAKYRGIEEKLATVKPEDGAEGPVYLYLRKFKEEVLKASDALTKAELQFKQLEDKTATEEELNSAELSVKKATEKFKTVRLEKAQAELDIELAKSNAAEVRSRVTALEFAKSGFKKTFVLINSEVDGPEQTHSKVAHMIRGLSSKASDDLPTDKEITDLTTVVTGRLQKSELGRIRAAMANLVDSVKKNATQDKSKERRIGTLYRLVRGLAAGAGFEENTRSDKMFRAKRVISIDGLGDKTVVIQLGAQLQFESKLVRVDESLQITIGADGEISTAPIQRDYDKLGIGNVCQYEQFGIIVIQSKRSKGTRFSEVIEIPYEESYVCVSSEEGLELSFPEKVKSNNDKRKPQSSKSRILLGPNETENQTDLAVGVEVLFTKENSWSSNEYRFVRKNSTFEGDKAIRSKGKESNQKREDSPDTVMLTPFSALVLSTSLITTVDEDLSASSPAENETGENETGEIFRAPKFDEGGLLKFERRNFTVEQWRSAADVVMDSTMLDERALAALDLAIICHASASKFNDSTSRGRSTFFLAVCRAAASRVFVLGGSPAQKQIITSALGQIDDAGRMIQGLTDLQERLEALESVTAGGKGGSRTKQRQALNLIPYRAPLIFLHSRIHRLPLHRTVSWMPYAKQFQQQLESPNQVNLLCLN